MENDDKKTFVFSIVKNQIESVKIFEQAFKDIQNALKDEDIKKASEICNDVLKGISTWKKTLEDRVFKEDLTIH